MDIEAELAAIFAGIDALAATAKEFHDIARAVKKDLPAADLSAAHDSLKAAANYIVAAYHGASPLAAKFKSDAHSVLGKLGHLAATLGHDGAKAVNDVADAVDPSVTTTEGVKAAAK